MGVVAVCRRDRWRCFWIGLEHRIGEKSEIVAFLCMVAGTGSSRALLLLLGPVKTYGSDGRTACGCCDFSSRSPNLELEFRIGANPKEVIIVLASGCWI